MEDLHAEFNSIVNSLDLDDEKVQILQERIENYLAYNLLDLSNLGLDSLSAHIFDNCNINHLNISNNQFVNLPEDVFYSMHNLLSLDMSYCLTPAFLAEDDLLTLPENIFQSLSNLLVLDISGNQIEFLPDGILSKLYNVEAINLSYNMLSLLPMSIGSCINLEELYLEGNFLPIEFKEVITDYLEVQDFIAPFSAAWAQMDSPLEMINEISLTDNESDENDEKLDIASKFKEMFEED